MASNATIVIVSWNAKEYLDKCLTSVANQSHPDYNVIFLDNGSGDGTVDFIRKRFPGVQLMSLDRNYGFAKANNIGIEEALKNPQTKHIVLLNSDTIVERDFLKELIATAESNPKIGCCQPRMLSVDDPKIFDAVGITLSKSGEAIQLGYDEPDSGQYNIPKEVFGANAGAALYGSEMLRQVGLLEEACFIYYEDVDLAIRARLAGWKCMYVPKAVVYHKHSIAFGKHSPIKEYLLTRNRYYYIIKNLPISFVLLFLLRQMKSATGLIIRIAFRALIFDRKGVEINALLLKAHFHALKRIPEMIKKRFEIRSNRVISNQELINWFQ
jgi:GT2 family glycosyltransferase